MKFSNQLLILGALALAGPSITALAAGEDSIGKFEPLDDTHYEVPSNDPYSGYHMEYQNQLRKKQVSPHKRSSFANQMIDERVMSYVDAGKEFEARCGKAAKANLPLECAGLSQNFGGKIMAKAQVHALNRISNALHDPEDIEALDAIKLKHPERAEAIDEIKKLLGISVPAVAKDPAAAGTDVVSGSGEMSPL